jgi:hypothetical protein
MKAAGCQPATGSSQDAGYFAYGTGWRLLDLLGLTTPRSDRGRQRRVRRLSPHPHPQCTQRSPARRPEAGSQARRPGAIPADYRFVKHLRFTNHYWWTELDYGYFIFVNRDANPRLVQGLESISVDVEKEMGWQRYGFRLLRRLAERP